MEKTETMPLGVVIERRRIDHPWKDCSWLPVAVIPGAPALDAKGPWMLLREGDGWIQYHAGTFALELFRTDTESYKVNLAQSPPRIFVMLRSEVDPDVEHDLVPFMVTASPYEAQDYLDSGEDIVEAVQMPDEIIALVQAFVDVHHVEQVFTKRKRTKAATGDEIFSRRPPVERPPRRRSGAGGRQDG